MTGRDLPPAPEYEHEATVLDPCEANDARLLADLRSDPHVHVLDFAAAQRKALRQLIPEPRAHMIDEPTRWVYYPWRRAVAHILGPTGYRRLRLDRNRHAITDDEQSRLGSLKVGVIGLSVGHAIVHALSAEGLCGELRLADFDDLELSNLNRVPASIFDLGLNKAVIAARRVAELDPYVRLIVETAGVDPSSVDTFMNGLDIVVEECDSLDAKVLVRESARIRGIPVLMATSDRGLMDVERFDLEPSRPVLHGLLGNVGTHELAALSTEDKVPYVLRILDAAQLSPRLAASLFEVNETLSTWPQLAGEVTLGAATVVETVRRIGLGEFLPSGRVRIDVGSLLAGMVDPLSAGRPLLATTTANDDVSDESDIPAGLSEIIAAAASRAPSGGNAQPWHIDIGEDRLTLRLAPELTSTMDVGFRGSAVALGAAVFNARIAAAAHGQRAEVSFAQGDERTPLYAFVRWSAGEEPELARLYGQMLSRETNRHLGTTAPLDDQVAAELISAAEREDARLRLLTSPDRIARGAAILAAADRIRYLTSHLHAEMFSELRWPNDPAPESGIDVRSLELTPSDLAVLDVLRRPDVVAQLARWDAGAVLGDATRDKVTACAAVGVVSVRGNALSDFARAGSAVESVWIAAQHRGLAVQPVSPVFLYAANGDDMQALSPSHQHELTRLQYDLRELAGTPPDESHALVLRFADAEPPSVRSRRRSLRHHRAAGG